jgi:hypothetical protein
MLARDYMASHLQLHADVVRWDHPAAILITTRADAVIRGGMAQCKKNESAGDASCGWRAAR